MDVTTSRNALESLCLIFELCFGPWLLRNCLLVPDLKKKTTLFYMYDCFAFMYVCEPCLYIIPVEGRRES